MKEMEDLSLKQRNELIVTCASDAAACKEKYGDIPANSMLVHEAIDRALGEDTGGDQIAGSGSSDTGGNQTLDPNGTKNNTGNDQSSGQGKTNTGNTDGKPDTGGNTTVTPILEQNKDDLAYTSDNSKYVPSPKHAAGGWGTPMDLSDSKAQEVLNNSIQGGKQQYGISDGKVYEF
ncbi:hypothetical protein [Yersinia bercovieri]|uniref:hypothetical protein n=1 Tax=Yersinia bercovieri TaxID=634 RepID=UPI0021BD85C6|nr:hypothetical protein [Yersinia bercovieri]